MRFPLATSPASAADKPAASESGVFDSWHCGNAVTGKAGARRFRCFAAGVAVGLAACTAGAQANTLTNNLIFGAYNQSPFATGAPINLEDSDTFGPNWNVPLPLGAFPNVNPLGFISPVLATKGQVGVEFGYALSGGSLNFNLPTTSTLTIPASAPAGTLVSVGTNSALAANGLTFAQSSAIDDARFRRLFGCFGGCSPGPVVQPGIDTKFPSLSAYLDLFAQAENALRVDAKYLSITGPKSTTLVNAPLPSIDARATVFALTPSKITTIVPGVTLDFGTPYKADFLSATFNYPNLKTSGGLNASGSLASSNQQTVANLNVNLVDLLRKTFPIIPPLSDTLSVGIGSVGYNLLSSNAGLNLNLRQSFSMQAEVRPFLYFDTPVSAIAPNGSILAPNNVVALPATGNVQFVLPNDLPRSSVTVKPFYGLENTLTNTTSLALTGYIDVSALSGSLDLDAGFASVKRNFGPLLPTQTAPVDLFSIPIFQSSFPVNVTPIWTQPFELGVDAPTALSRPVRAQLVTRRADGSAIYDVREIISNEFSVDLGNFIGREFTAPDGTLQFLSDLAVPDSHGNSRGRLFCVYCPEGDALPQLVSSSSTLIDGNPVYVNDLFENLFAPPSDQVDSQFLAAFDAAHAPSGYADYVPTQLLVNEVVTDFQTPEPGSALLVCVALLGLMLARGRAEAAAGFCCRQGTHRPRQGL